MTKAEQDNLFKIAAKAVAAYGVYKYFVAPFLKNYEKTANKDELERKAKEYTYKIKTKSGKVYTINLETFATVINDAFRGNPLMEDEERAIDILGQVPSQNPNLVLVLANVYKSNFGKDLKADFVKFLSPAQWKRVAFKFAAM